MSRVRVLVLLLALLFGAAFTAASPARADEQSFIDAVTPLGYNDPANALSAGYAVCSMKKAVGLSITERILRRILNKLDDAVHSNNSSPFANAASVHLCPRF
jgi:hypothetical protein